MKRNLIENLTIQSNIPCYRARLAGNLYVVSDYSPTFDKVEYYVSQIMDSRFSFIAPARLVISLLLLLLSGQWFVFIPISWVLWLEVDDICARLSFKIRTIELS